MTGAADVPELERVTFFKGQRLLAADLNQAGRVLRELRWLHNRSLHGWGIAFDLAVSGEKGAAQVRISPGYAVDRLGREIILTEAQTMLVPPVAGDASGDSIAYYLTISYPDDEDLVVSTKRDGVCAPAGAVRLAEVSQLRWLARSDWGFRPGLDLILALAQVKNCQLSQPLSFTQRRSARPASQPYIAAGQTAPGETRWDEIKVGGALVGFATQVDTSVARFHTTPAYQAHVIGRRLDRDHTFLWVIAGFTHISNPTSNGFKLEVMLPDGVVIQPGGIPLNPRDRLSVDRLQELGWYVVWMGAE